MHTHLLVTWKRKNAFVLFNYKIQESLFWDINCKNHAEVEECSIQFLEVKRGSGGNWGIMGTWLINEKKYFDVERILRSEVFLRDWEIPLITPKFLEN